MQLHETQLISNPILPLSELRNSGQEDCSVHLSVSDCFEQEDYPDKFDAELKKMTVDFSVVVESLNKEMGAPVFMGDADAQAAPAWAGTGHAVAYWTQSDWRIYVIIRHVGHEMPLELIMGIVCNPSEDWYA